jgi:hypothetical protein
VRRTVQIYRQLLRLYPPGFRADYADEMQQVFAQAVEEGSGGWLTLLAEIRDLPASALREHLRESRRSTVVLQTEGVTMSLSFKRTFSYCLWAILMGAVVYALLIIFPFFALGLHLQPENMVRGGMFDPKGYAIYGDGTYGNILSLATISVLLIAPIWELVFGGALVVTLGRYWPFFPRHQQRIGILAVMVSIGVIGFIFSPLGRLIMVWRMD